MALLFAPAMSILPGKSTMLAKEKIVPGAKVLLVIAILCMLASIKFWLPPMFCSIRISLSVTVTLE